MFSECWVKTVRSPDRTYSVCVMLMARGVIWCLCRQYQCQCGDKTMLLVSPFIVWGYDALRCQSIQSMGIGPCGTLVRSEYRDGAIQDISPFRVFGQDCVGRQSIQSMGIGPCRTLVRSEFLDRTMWDVSPFRVWGQDHVGCQSIQCMGIGLCRMLVHSVYGDRTVWQHYCSHEEIHLTAI